MKRIITILLFILTNLVELLIIGELFITYSAYLNIFPWHETDPIMLVVVWSLIIVFLVIGVILCLIRKKLPVSKINTRIPFYTIGYLSFTILLIDFCYRFAIISGCFVIVISFFLIIYTTITSLKNIKGERLKENLIS